ncbi:hypothetical protein [Rufibacter tibetensis]|nr:hypothetical protein [Rufibacter tibetensis]
MKMMLLSLTFFLSTAASYSQVKTDSTTQGISISSQKLLLDQSKSQKKAGKILFWGGIGLLVTGVATYEVPFYPLGRPAVEEEVDNTFPIVLMVTGVLSSVIGVVQITAAKRSKAKALSMVIHQKRISVIQQGAFTSKPAPALGLQVTF